MINPQIKRNILSILPFAVLWFAFSLLYVLVEKGIMGNATIYPSTGNPYLFPTGLYITVLTSTCMGILVGSIEVFYLNKVFIHRSFSQKLFGKTLIYVGFILGFLFFLTLFSNTLRTGTSPWNPEVLTNVQNFFSDFVVWSIAIYMAAIIGVSLFYMEVSDNMGQEVLFNFFTGKYHRPIEEERIFMFLDMRSSTTIAEKLGHVAYFDMLNSYYADLSPPIVRYAGEIYQYVGDEVVVSWSLKKGLRQGNCLKCFFAMKQALIDQAEAYHQKYGLVPRFKGGFHVGRVSVGEIGTIKQSIVFSGDILNATARIQSLCNSYKVDILISHKLKSLLDPTLPFSFLPVGQAELRGKEEKMELYSVQASG